MIKMNNITKDFPGVRALDDVSINIEAGEVRALAGENGAGKSTLGKIIGGILSKDKGTLYIDGTEVRKNSPTIAHNLGVSLVFQELGIIPSLTITQYLFLAHEPLIMHFLVNKNEILKKSKKLLSDLGIEIDPNAKLSELSIGQQQIISVARALAFNPKILILDEPTSSLTNFEIEKLFKIVKKIKSQGVAIIYISHRLDEIFEIADSITVLRDGKIINTIKVAEASIDNIINMMVGRDIVKMYPKIDSIIGKEVLKLSSVTKKGVCNNIDLVAREGEVIGLYGLMGAGRTELAKIVFGLDFYDSGSIKVFDKEIKKNNLPFYSVLNRVGFLPENRKEEGLCMVLSIQHNIIRASLKKLFPKWFIKPNLENNIANKYIKKLNIITDSAHKKVIFLSGGNQQKVVLAHWMSANSKLLILDEPTRGIDVGAKVEVYKIIHDLVKEGVGIILISSDLPEIIGMCSRIYVMTTGEIGGVFSGGEIDPDKILACAIGKSKSSKKAGNNEI